MGSQCDQYADSELPPTNINFLSIFEIRSLDGAFYGDWWSLAPHPITKKLRGHFFQNYKLPFCKDYPKYWPSLADKFLTNTAWREQRIMWHELKFSSESIDLLKNEMQRLQEEAKRLTNKSKQFEIFEQNEEKQRDERLQQQFYA